MPTLENRTVNKQKAEIYLHIAQKQNPPRGMLCMRYPDVDPKMVFTTYLQGRQSWTAAIEFIEKFTRQPYPIPKEIADYLHPPKGNADGIKTIPDDSPAPDSETHGSTAVPNPEGPEPSLPGNPDSAGPGAPAGGIIAFPGAATERDLPPAPGD